MILNYRAVIKRIGNFIAEVRKQQNMTQRELAEKIGVSDKTISKWETGKSMPELGYLQQLCETLQINVNELLSGERLSGDDYPRKAEETIMALMKDNETNKKKNIRDMIIGIVLAVAAFAFMFAMTQSGNPTYYVDMGSFAVVVLLSGAAVLLSGKRNLVGVLKVLKEVLVPVGMVGTLISFVMIMATANDYSAVYHNLSVCVLSVLYAVIAKIVVVIMLEKRQ